MLLLIAFFCLLSCAFAQTGLDGLIATAPAMDAYPEASAMILRDFTRIEFLPSGQVVRHYELLWKTRDRAAHASDRCASDFSSDRDTMIVEAARTRLSDGTWIEQLSDSIFGDVFFLKYRIEPFPDVKHLSLHYAGGEILFGGYEPILGKQFIVEASPPWKIRYDLQKDAPEPIVTEDQNRKIFDWTVDECPQIVTDANSVGLADLVARVLWTSFADWEELGVYVADPFWEKVDSSQAAVDGFLQITSPDLQGIPALMNVALWVLQNIRRVPSPSASMDYVPHSADHVWKNRSGNSLDKVVLLTALLRAYGFAPIPVLVPHSDAPFTNLPALEQFHHVILSVPVGEDTIWLDPSADDFPPGELPYLCTYGKGCMLLAGTPMLIDVPVGSPESRGAKTEIRAALSSDGTLSGTVTCQPKGDLAAEARRLFKDRSTPEQEVFFQETASRIKPGAKATHFSVSNPADLSLPVSIEMGFESPEYAVPQDDTILLQLPLSPFRFAESGFQATLPGVRYPHRLPTKCRVTNDVTISIPKGYAVSVAPPPLIMDNPYVFTEIISHFDQTSVTWTSTVEIKADKVPVADYPVVREVYETLNLPKNHLVILEKK